MREYWATCSILDHRRPYFRQALVLFDRVVIPIATRPLGDLTPKELDRLSQDADRLKKEGAAVKVEWDPDSFAAWREAQPSPLSAEGLTSLVNRDPLYDTRVQMVHETPLLMNQLAVDDVLAIPVYGSRGSYDRSIEKLGSRFNAQALLNLELLKLLPVPRDDVQLDDILRLRAKDSFREAIRSLHRWEEHDLGEALKNGDESTVRDAVKEYGHWIRQYTEAIQDARFDKIRTGVISILVLGASATAIVATAGAAPLLAMAGAAPGVAEALFSVRKLMRPCWKQVADSDFAAAGVVYEAQKLFEQPR